MMAQSRLLKKDPHYIFGGLISGLHTVGLYTKRDAVPLQFPFISLSHTDTLLLHLLRVLLRSQSNELKNKTKKTKKKTHGLQNTSVFLFIY